jgi:hypothetical protein
LGARRYLTLWSLPWPTHAWGRTTPQSEIVWMALAPTGAAPGAALARRTVAVPFLERLALGLSLDVLVVASLLAVAGIVRWHNLLLSPQFPSVTETILMALDVANGRAFYLSDGAPYLGAPFLWLLALVYRIAGPSLEATLLVPWAIGALTVVPTYLLGREVGGRIVGTFGAALLATSGAHTVISSHVPLSHSLTPLVATTARWVLVLAVGRAEGDLRRGGRLLALAGLLAGVALQTHPTVAPLLAGAAGGCRPDASGLAPDTLAGRRDGAARSRLRHPAGVPRDQSVRGGRRR